MMDLSKSPTEVRTGPDSPGHITPAWKESDVENGDRGKEP